MGQFFDNFIYYTGLLMAFVIIVVSLIIGYPEEKSESYYGLGDYETNEFDHCKTSMRVIENLSDRLVYLNGVWTAGCIDETIKRRELRDKNGL